MRVADFHGSALDLEAHNGGVTVTNTVGSMQFEASNGEVNVLNFRGSILGNNHNGGIVIRNAALTARSAYQLRTSNGDIIAR